MLPPPEVPPPLLSPAYLSEAETYYLRRLTSALRRRPEHHTECPFYRPQAPQRFREQAGAALQAINPPEGFFLAHRLAPEKLSQMPDEADDDRSRGLAASELKGEKKSHLAVHAQTGKPCPVCGDTVREVSFADTSLQYCPTCQTGGKPLADRRMSKLLR